MLFGRRFPLRALFRTSSTSVRKLHTLWFGLPELLLILGSGARPKYQKGRIWSGKVAAWGSERLELSQACILRPDPHTGFSKAHSGRTESLIRGFQESPHRVCWLLISSQSCPGADPSTVASFRSPLATSATSFFALVSNLQICEAVTPCPHTNHPKCLALGLSLPTSIR